MAQWFALKGRHPDALLFFRMGDFYELFFGDAEAAAAALDIALTARGTHGGEPIAMCGVPVHAASAYLARLIRRGFRVAVAEQIEPPRKPGSGGGKAPLARDVVRLVTAGTLFEDELLEPGRANLLLALHAPAPPRGGTARGERDGPGHGQVGAAWIDVSTGMFECATVSGRSGLGELLGRLEPAEILCSGAVELGEHERRRGPEPLAPAVGSARDALARAFGVASLDAFGAFSDAEVVAAAIVRDYARDAAAGREPVLSRPVPGAQNGMLGIDPATRTSLDLLRTRTGEVRHSLLGAVDRTVSGAGTRLLAGWIAAPLAAVAPIEERQDGWGFLVGRPGSAAMLRTALRGCPDLARALGRLGTGRGTPRDLAQVRGALWTAGEVEAALHGIGDDMPAMLRAATAAMRGGRALGEELRRALAEDPPARLDDGGAIAAGYDGELDAERALRDGDRRAVAAMQNEYAQRFGVASLKIRHHAQLGYVLEVPAGAAERMRNRDALVLRQGTASVCRFSTAELEELDARIAAAGERAQAREKLVFEVLVGRCRNEAALPAVAEALAILDVLQGAAALAENGDWCRPLLGEDTSFRLSRLRHPVVEAALPAGERFVPNDCDLSPERRVMLLTGPNMAGKSTFLRQAALAVVLAQAGLPVPAASARMGIVDRLFSRVGAADDLARGRSTFMVEMIEAAAILHSAGPRSLVVVDEIGRGTSTQDGLAIAWAVLESLHGAQRCRAIFATHFHELGELAASLGALSPHTMSVREWKKEVVFRHEVVPGVASRSWGVHVARLAGVPEPVVRRAGRLLVELERAREAARPALPLFGSRDAAGAAVTDAGENAAETGAQTGAQTGAEDAARRERLGALARLVGELDPDLMTPREALDALYRLRTAHAALHDDAVAAGGDALGIS